MSVYQFDVTQFRTLYPAFANVGAFPTATLQQFWYNALSYIEPYPTPNLYGYRRLQAINLMTAHLVALSVLIAAGQTPGIVSGATIDKISVTLDPPPKPNQFQWWLNTTPYGQQLLAILQVNSTSGFYVGGSPQIGAFRGASGVGWNGWGRR